MDKIVVSDIIFLGNKIYKDASSGKNVSAVLFYEEATALMRDLLEYDDVSIGCIDIAEESFDGYKNEYIVSLSDNLELCVEKAYAENADDGKGCYLKYDADVLYVDGDANYSVVMAQVNDECVEHELDFGGGADKCTPDYGKSLLDCLELFVNILKG